MERNDNMKNKLKRINRGLVLGGIIIVVMVFYIIIDARNFKSEKPQIEQTVSDFVTELAEFNVTPEKYRTDGIEYSTEDAEKRISEFEKFTDKYWTAGEPALDDFGWASYMSTFRSSMKDVIDQVDRGYITSYSAQPSNVEISKDGPNAAIVTCEINTLYTCINNSIIISPMGNDDYYDDTPYEDEMLKVSRSFECTFNMERTSDGWKIISCECYTIEYSNTIDSEE